MKLILLGLTLLAASCTSTIIQKVKLQSIDTVAVVSLFAAHRIPEVRGDGLLRKMDNEGHLQIAEDALNAFTHAFTRLGWKVVPADELSQKDSYKNGFKSGIDASLTNGSASQAFAPRYFTPSDMFAVWLGEPFFEVKAGRKLVKDQREFFLDLLHELKSDTGIFLKMQYCFRTIERERKEMAFITATSGIQLVDNKGQLLFEKPIADGCGGTQRGESKRSMEIPAGDWMYDILKRDEFRALFKEASEAEAARLTKSLPVTPHAPKKPKPEVH